MCVCAWCVRERGRGESGAAAGEERLLLVDDGLKWVCDCIPLLVFFVFFSHVT